MKDETLEQAERALVGAALHSVRSGGPVLAARPAAEFCLVFAKMHADARARPLREALEAARVYITGTIERLRDIHSDIEAAIDAEQAHAEARREPREGSEG